MLKQAWMMKNVKPVYRDDSALKIGMEYHQNLEKLIADLSTMDAIVLPSGVSITTLGDRVLVSMSSPGGPVSGMPSSVDGVRLRSDKHFIEYTAFNTRTNNGVYEVTSIGDGSSVRITAVGLSTPALHELRRSGKRLSKRNIEQAARTVNRKVRALAHE